MPGPRRVLVRLPNWVGDVVMATPALAALRAGQPHSEIHLVGKARYEALLGGLGLHDVFHPIRPEDGSGWRRAWRVGRRLAPLAIDRAILLTNSLSTALEVFAARIPVRIGRRGDGRSPLLTHRLPPLSAPRSMVEIYGELVGAVEGAPVLGRPKLAVTQEESRWYATWAQLNRSARRPFIGLNPGASFGVSKMWSVARYAELVRAIASEGEVVLLGGPGEENLLAEIAGRSGVPVIDTSRAVVPLGPLKALLADLDVLITTDSGPRSMARALGTPTVTLMGPTHPGWTDFGDPGDRVLRRDVPCGPCHQPRCAEPRHRCMEEIGLEEVVEAVRATLP